MTQTTLICELCISNNILLTKFTKICSIWKGLEVGASPDSSPQIIYFVSTKKETARSFHSITMLAEYGET